MDLGKDVPGSLQVTGVGSWKGLGLSETQTRIAGGQSGIPGELQEVPGRKGLLGGAAQQLRGLCWGR